MFQTKIRKPKLTLSIDQKYKILRLFKCGATIKDLAKRYNVSEITIRKMISEQNEITTYFESTILSDSHFTKQMRTSQRRDLEKVIYHWCMRCKDRGITLTNPLIHKKALEFNAKLYREPDFQATWCWVRTFMYRYSICGTDICHFRTANQTNADTYKIRFKEFLNYEGYSLKNVYNVDYTGLIWRSLPEETSMFRTEQSPVTPKMYKDHVTVLLCANATGCHKLPVLVIAKIGDSLDSKKANINSLSIMYEENSNALMDNDLFNKWFEKCFLKSVIERQNKSGCKEKFLLLVDNARWNYNLEEAENRDESVFVTTFPHHVTPLIQPMDRGIIRCFKRMYRKELVETIMPLVTSNMLDNAILNHKDLIMWDCCRMIRDAWSNVENTILENAWGKLLMEKDDQKKFGDISIIKKDIKETVSLLHQLPGCQRCNTVGVKNWYEIDNEEKIFMKLCTDEVLRDFKNNALV